jgi:anaerobic selenocysteine-containing dehydrogenase
MFEQEDLVTAYWHPYLQLRRCIAEPPGEVKAELEIWRLLCKQFGFDTSYFPADTRETLRRMLPRPEWLEALGDGPLDPSGKGEVVFSDFRFPTPSGKVEFASSEATSLWNVSAVPEYLPLAEGHASPLAGRFPLQLLSCKTRDRIHSQFGNLDWVQEVERPHTLDIHPSDASARGLSDGDEAVAWNDRGSIRLRVRLDHGIRPGVVHVLEGRCHAADPDVNLLTGEGVTDMNNGATFYECLVEVVRA